jgi:hypothetical protein
VPSGLGPGVDDPLAAHFGEGASSKDGLHHLVRKPTMISTLQAILPLSLTSTDTNNSNLS